jgi:phosphohistidine phosphatase SixA
MKIPSRALGRLLVASITISLIGVMAGCATVTHSKPGTSTTIILTRHGDRDALSTVLNDKGRLRAQALVKAVGHMKITAIYSPDLTRNRDTAKPLAKHLGIKTTVVSSSPSINEVTSTMLTKHTGEIVLWVGNSNNLEGIYELLGGEGSAPTSYGDLYIMKIKDSGDPEVTQRSYGPR